jgi:hypothetical protein
MTISFVLQHLHTLPGGEEDIKILGVYATKEDAESAVARFRMLPGFRDRPILRNLVNNESEVDGFYISDMEVGLDYWPEGYETR